MNKAKKQSLRYLGPSFSVLQNGTVFNDGELPKGIQLLINKCPAVGMLMVKDGDIEKTLARLRNPHSAESVFYFKITKFMKGGI